MRATPKRKEDPHLVDTMQPAPTAPKKSTRPKRSKDQRLNLKRSYEAFLEATKKAGSAARSLPSPSETWPMRPYAASV